MARKRSRPLLLGSALRPEDRPAPACSIPDQPSLVDYIHEPGKVCPYWPEEPNPNEP